MNFASVIDYVGVPQIANYGGFDVIPTVVPPTPLRIPLGTIVQASDQYWGSGEFIYVQMPASTAAKVGTLMTYDSATAFLAALAPVTTLLGKPLGVLIQPLASSTIPQYGWLQISGYAAIWSGVNIAANTAIAASTTVPGQGAASVAGKALLNCRVTLPSSTNFTKIIGTTNGSPNVIVPNTDGIIPGMLVAGTGVPAATSVASVDITGKLITLSANCTATNSVTGTFTYATAADFFNLCTFNRIAHQGPIT